MDDLTYEAVLRHQPGSVGDSIFTPHLDRLRSMGTTFTHAYNMGGWNGAICLASRAMLISGRYLWRAQEISGKWRDGDNTALQQTWGRLLTEAGYRTYMSGKWHVDAPADVVFDTVRHIRPGMPPDAWGSGGGGREVASAIRQGTDIAGAMPVGYNRPLSPDDYSWDPSDTTYGGFWSGGTHWSEVLRDDALDFITQASARAEPFFMYLAFNAAHDPRQSPKEFLDLYDVDDIAVPPDFSPLYPDYDRIGLGPGLRDEALAPFPRTKYAVQKNRQEYYALISHMDEQIGQILDALESKVNMENTYVVFTADHGLAVGHHGLMGKQNMYDHSLRVPFIIAGPGVPAGVQRHQPIYLQDAMPTVLEWAGADIPAYIDFNSLTGTIADSTAGSSYAAIYGAYERIHRMIIQGGFKLITYPAIGKTLLYDLTADPHEMNNLADLPAYREKVRSLTVELARLQDVMDDPLAAKD